MKKFVLALVLTFCLGVVTVLAADVCGCGCGTAVIEGQTHCGCGWTPEGA